jgi:tight adherence protein C
MVALCGATLLAAVWLVLLGMVSREDWLIAAYNKVLDDRDAIATLRLRGAARRKRLARYPGPAARVMKIFLSGNLEKKTGKRERNIACLQNGELKGLNICTMPGYVLQRKFTAIGRGALHKTILAASRELYGKRHAANKSKQLLAQLLSYPLIGVAVALSLGALCLSAGDAMFGLALTTAGPAIALTFAYSLYDALRKKAKRRREAIRRQFPNVVSKLALLTTSGMIMERAWQETAYSQELELYKEMRQTAEELDNLVSPEIAYSGFISRCNTGETSKLAAAITQNLSKGNAEIGRLLKTMAQEAWLERRHLAKRDSEKANSQLLIPIMLLFFAILLMIMAPVAMNFTVL